jgi:hypothetical protein
VAAPPPSDASNEDLRALVMRALDRTELLEKEVEDERAE